MPDPPAHVEAYLELVRAHDSLSRDSQKFFQAHGISEQQYNVLRILYVRDGGGGIPCSAISARLLNRVPDITRLLDRLEKAGLVARKRCPSDRRVVRAALTEAGHELVEMIHEPLVQHGETRMSVLSEDELRTLTELLGKLRVPAP